MDEGRAATYVLVEIGEAAYRGGLDLQRSLEGWTRGLFSSGSFVSVDLTVDIVLRAEQLYSIPERTDRLIAATAAH